MTQQELAEEKLKGMLRAAELPVKASYCTSEVCRILGIVERTFRRYTDAWEPDENGRPRVACSLNSTLLHSNRRVAFPDLVDFLVRNNSYQRQMAVHPDQLDLFDRACTYPD